MFDFLLAPAVIWMRMPIIASEMCRSPLGHLLSGSRLESERMVTEKLSASLEGWANAGAETMRMHFRLVQLVWQGRPQAFSLLAARAPMRVVAAFHAPAGLRVRQNTRRLSGQTVRLTDTRA
ncbi:MAG TPA: hypothetical protein PKW21_14940 [Rhabdaerophilum sp.]|nr:hypothetical protein [Rhabdaerophilum sp.]